MQAIETEGYFRLVFVVVVLFLRDIPLFPAGNCTDLFLTFSSSRKIAIYRGGPLPREGRISKARNLVLDHLYHSPVATKYVMVVDMDVLGWDTNGVADSFGRKGWDVMCAHGILLHGIYRDTYAFRTIGINTNHHWAGKDHGVYNISDEDYKRFRSRLKVGIALLLHLLRIPLVLLCERRLEAGLILGIHC